MFLHSVFRYHTLQEFQMDVCRICSYGRKSHRETLNPDRHNRKNRKQRNMRQEVGRFCFRTNNQEWFVSCPQQWTRLKGKKSLLLFWVCSFVSQIVYFLVRKPKVAIFGNSAGNERLFALEWIKLLERYSNAKK